MTANDTSRRLSMAHREDALESPTVPAPPVCKPSVAPKTYGHYAIEHRPDGSPWMLGRGGMGMTFKALDTNLRCPVALKIIGPQCFGGERSEHRFVREAQLAAQIRHPNVAAIHHLDCQDGEFFYAMEFVDGISADAWVRQRGPMSADLALDIVMQVTRALTAADQLHVLHRDIKPGNIMILPDPANGNRVIAKLIDFGLARCLSAEATPTATTCGFTGTPQFASPEQAENLELDVRSDIYSLGSTLWYFLVGEAPFTGTPARIIAQLLTAEPPWDRVKKLPKEVKGLLRTMLAKDPAGRPQTPVALHNHIMACREKLAQRPARSTTQCSERRGAFPLGGRYNIHSLALAGALGVALVFLMFLPRARDDSGKTQQVMVKPIDAAYAPPVRLPAVPSVEAPKPQVQESVASVVPAPVESTGSDAAPVPDFSPVTVDLADFDREDYAFSIPQVIPDSAAATDLEQQGDLSFSMAGLGPQDEAHPAKAAAKAADQRSDDHHRGGKQQRRSSAWRSVDQVRGGVEGLIRHFF